MHGSRLVVLMLAIAVPVAAAGVPQTIDQQGRFLRVDGSPEKGTLKVTFALYAAATAGSALWSEVQMLALDGSGFYAADLGQATPFPAGLWNGQSLFLGITVDGESEMTPRQPVVSVPYAVKASVADDVTGDIHPNSISVNGSTVIDSAGRLTGAASVMASAPLYGAGTVQNPLALPRSSGVASGYLGSVDFAAFQSKVSSLAAGAGVTLGGTATAPIVGVAFGNAMGTVCDGADARLSDARDPRPGSASYIQNGNAAQNASFNVSGTGAVGGDATFGGAVRMSNNANVVFRNGANNADLAALNVDAADRTTVAGQGRLFLQSRSEAVEIDSANTAAQVTLATVIDLSTAGANRMRITAAGAVGVGTTSPGHKLDVAGDINAASDLGAYNFSMTTSINVRAIVNKAAANAVCPVGATAIYTPWACRGQTGSQICAADSRGLKTCAAVRFVYVTEANAFGAYAPADQPCNTAVANPWPWGNDYNAPDTLDGEWGHGDTHVVCCQ